MAIYGYNTSEIANLQKTVSSVASDLATSITTKFQNNFINPMAEAWYAPEAVQWFTSFKETMLSYPVPLIGYFNGYIETLQIASDNWAKTTGADIVTIPLMDQDGDVFKRAFEHGLDCTGISSENGKGDRGIDVDAARQICSGNLPGIKAQIDQELSAFSSKIEAESSFLGGNQAEAAKTCFGQIGELIKQLFVQLLEGENSLPAAVTSYIDKYTATAQTNATGLENVANQ